MLGKILVPLDGSPSAELALPRALALATASGASLHLVTVAQVGAGNAPTVGNARAPGETADRAALVRGAEAYLEGVAERLGTLTAGVDVTGYVLPPGNTVSSLVQEIGAEEVDLVVMTSHGRGPVARAWLGSVTDGVVRQSPRPVLVLRPDVIAGDGSDGFAEEPPRPAEPFRRVLVPLDGSRDASEVLGPAAEIAELDGAEVVLLAVVPPASEAVPPFLSEPPAVDEPRARELAARAGEELEAAAEEVRERGLRVQTRIRPGSSPAIGILSSAREEGAELIAMTTRGRGGAARLILGSVVDKVVRGAEVPLLLHRPRRREEG